MISDSFFVLSILVSSLLAFFTTAFIVEMGMRIFSVRKFRVRSFLRLLPFFSLAIDFIFHRFSLGNWLNPLSCDSCTQKFVLQMFFPKLKNHLAENQISIVKYLAVDGFDALFSAAFILFCCFTAFLLMRKICQILLTCNSLRLMERQGTSCGIPIQNQQLEKVLIKENVRLLTHPNLKIPLTGYNRTIFIPAHIVQTLPLEELEAVIVHELEHVRFRDFFFKTFCQIMGALAWWIPLKSWMKTTEQELELACDEGTAKYHIKPHLLASAMVKLAKDAYNNPYRKEICYFTDQKKTILVRIQQLLGLSPKQQKKLFWITGAWLIGGGIILFMCIQFL